MMIPSEMPSVTMGENGHGNGNNDIYDNDLDGDDLSDNDLGKEQEWKGLSSKCFHEMRIICEGG